MTLDQSLLAVVAIATVFGLYFTARAYRNANRRHKIDRLRPDLDAWQGLMFVEDPYYAVRADLELTFTSNITDGYDSARDVAGRSFRRVFDRFIKHRRRYLAECEDFSESIRKFVSERTAMHSHDWGEENVPFGYSITPLFHQSIYRRLIYDVIKIVVERFEYSAQPYNFNWGQRLEKRIGHEVRLRWNDRNTAGIYDDRISRFTDGADEKPSDMVITGRLSEAKAVHESLFIEEPPKTFVEQADSIVRQWRLLEIEAKHLRSKFAKIRAR